MHAHMLQYIHRLTSPKPNVSLHKVSLMQVKADGYTIFNIADELTTLPQESINLDPLVNTTTYSAAITVFGATIGNLKHAQGQLQSGSQKRPVAGIAHKPLNANIDQLLASDANSCKCSLWLCCCMYCQHKVFQG